LFFEQNGIWCNSSDQAGTIMSAMVWLLMLYSAFTVTALTATEGIPPILGEAYAVLVFLSLASHAKTSLTDPGSVPVQAIPSERQRLLRDSHSMCGQCQTFKPPGSHHCRICNRCISRMEYVLFLLFFFSLLLLPALLVVFPRRLDNPPLLTPVYFAFSPLLVLLAFSFVVLTAITVRG
jgi:DHHC palmitoyltransferase